MMEKLQSWWHGITAREQRLVVAGGILLLVGLFYWSVWQPIANRIAERERQVQNQQQTLAWLKEKGKRCWLCRVARVARSIPAAPWKGWSTAPPSTTRSKIARLQPQAQELQVWIDTVQFDDLLLWLSTLVEQHGIQVQIIEIAREDLAPGLVKVRRLQLSRPQ